MTKIPLKILTQIVIRRDENDDAYGWATLQELLRVWPHVLVGIGIIAAALGAKFGGSETYGWPIAIVVAQTGFRWMVRRWFVATARPVDLQKWLWLFLIAATISGIAWGVSLMLLLIDAGPREKTLILVIASVIIQSTFSRAFMAPLAALCQTGAILIMVTIAGLYRGDYLLFPLSLVYLAFQIAQLRQIIAMSLAERSAELGRLALLDMLKTSNHDLTVANGKLARAASTDELTDLANRRSFDAHLKMALAQARQQGEPLSLLLIDVDHFKRFNDTHGHIAGDECLRSLGRLLNEACAGTHWSPARYGGEEFAVIMPRASAPDAEVFAGQLLSQMRSLDLSAIAEWAEPITLSIGLATADRHEDGDAHDLLARADQGLYAAKQAGRNRIRQVQRVP